MLDKKDFDNKNEDKFNQVLSTSKENGGLLASIGLKKGADDDSINDESQDEDPHKKSDLFDKSKDRIEGKNSKAKGDGNLSDEDDFDLGFGSSKKGDDGLEGGKIGGMGVELDIEGMSDAEQSENAKIIDE